MSKVTLSVIKADVGSIGGHTKPSEPMLEAVRSRVRRASANLFLDGLVTCTGDDIAIIMSHRRGVGAPDHPPLCLVLPFRLMAHRNPPQKPSELGYILNGAITPSRVTF